MLGLPNPKPPRPRLADDAPEEWTTHTVRSEVGKECSGSMVRLEGVGQTRSWRLRNHPMGPLIIPKGGGYVRWPDPTTLRREWLTSCSWCAHETKPSALLPPDGSDLSFGTDVGSFAAIFAVENLHKIETFLANEDWQRDEGAP